MKNFFLLIIFFTFSGCAEFTYSGRMNQYYLKKKDYSWKAFQTKEFIVYYKEESLASKNLLLVEKKINKGFLKAKEITKTETVKIPIYFFVVDDKSDFNTLTNLSYTGVAYAKSNTIIESYFLLGESHEIVHLISQQLWQRSKIWIMEGFSVYSDNKWGGKDLIYVCSKLNKENKLIPLKKMIKSDFSKLDPQVAYPQSGLLVKYLIDTYGFEKFKKFWKSKNVEKTYSISIDILENDWMEYLQK